MSANPPKARLAGKGASSPQEVRVAARSSRAGSGTTSRCGRDGSPLNGANTRADETTQNRDACRGIEDHRARPGRHAQLCSPH